MNVAIRIDSTQDLNGADTASGAGRIARIEFFDTLPSVESIWRQMERNDAVRTPYQSYDFLSSWQRHIGEPTGTTPCVVVGFDCAGKPAFLWPMGRTRKGPLNVLAFLGGKHANFNLGVWRRDILGNFTADDIRAVLAEISTGYRADILSLSRQPLSWQGFVNPFAHLPHQPSPSEGLRLTMTASSGDEQISHTLSSTMRGQLRSKERRLQKLGDYRYHRATTRKDVERLMEAFFPLKAAHMAAQALPNIFNEPRQVAFLREACLQGMESGTPLVEIHAIEGGGELLALFAAITDGRRASGMFNTYTLSDNARQSPGLVLLVHVIADLAERGMQAFDLGVGEAKYKTTFCKEPEPLFDSFLPLTPLGKLAAVTASTSGRVKRKIKQSDVLWNLIRKLQQRFAGL